ncbi:MAG: PEP-CTERM sorting domain-containing protein [Pirellulales bacterium]
MNSSRSRILPACGIAAALAVASCLGTARADELTQAELPQIFMTVANSSGSQGFVDIGSPSVDTGSVDTATSFTVGSVASTGDSVGYFTGLPTQTFGPFTIDTAVPTSVGFGNATFGTFSSTSITEQANALGTRSFAILGSYIAGTFNPSLTPNPAQASLLVSFMQTPGGSGVVTDTAVLSLVATAPLAAVTAVPEPSTLVLAGVGVASVLIVDQTRRHRRRRREALSPAGLLDEPDQDRG